MARQATGHEMLMVDESQTIEVQTRLWEYSAQEKLAPVGRVWHSLAHSTLTITSEDGSQDRRPVAMVFGGLGTNLSTSTPLSQILDSCWCAVGGEPHSARDAPSQLWWKVPMNWIPEQLGGRAGHTASSVGGEGQVIVLGGTTWGHSFPTDEVLCPMTVWRFNGVRLDQAMLSEATGTRIPPWQLGNSVGWMLDRLQLVPPSNPPLWEEVPYAGTPPPGASGTRPPPSQ